MKVRGNVKNLGDGRLVFVGRNKDDVSDYKLYIGFVNDSGKTTRLALNPDAANALRSLMEVPDGDEPFHEPMHFAWQIAGAS